MRCERAVSRSWCGSVGTSAEWKVSGKSDANMLHRQLKRWITRRWRTRLVLVAVLFDGSLTFANPLLSAHTFGRERFLQRVAQRLEELAPTERRLRAFSAKFHLHATAILYQRGVTHVPNRYHDAAHPLAPATLAQIDPDDGIDLRIRVSSTLGRDGQLHFDIAGAPHDLVLRIWRIVLEEYEKNLRV